MKITKIGSHKNNLLYMQLSTNILVFCNHWTGGLSSLYVSKHGLGVRIQLRVCRHWPILIIQTATYIIYLGHWHKLQSNSTKQH